MTHEEMFKKYLDDKCPLCDGYVDSEDCKSHTSFGGKLMALHFCCEHCHSKYIIGFRRSSYPIESEITFDNFNKTRNYDSERKDN